MTDDANPNEPKGSQLLAQFLQDWTNLWREELQAQLGDAAATGTFARTAGSARSSDNSAAMELWRTAMGAWAETMGLSPPSMVRPRDRSTATGSAAAAAAPDPRDAEIERLARRVDDLEARLAKLETPRRRRG
jgi:ubiquinone biosynthesis protein UbiJ